MNIYLSPKFHEQLNRQIKPLTERIHSLFDSLQSMPHDKVFVDSRLKKVPSHGDLYMINVDNLRLFASKANTGNEPVLVFLDIQEKRGSPRYLHLLSDESLKWEVDSLVANTNHVIIDDDKVNAEISSTNALGWWLDDYEINSIEKHPDGSITAKMSFQLSGDQDEDRPYSGTEITGLANVYISEDGEVTYEVKKAHVEDWDEPPPEGRGEAPSP